MIYQAHVLALHDDVEEAVVIEVSGVQINCFAGVCPYAIKEDKIYPVRLELVVINDYEVSIQCRCRVGVLKNWGRLFVSGAWKIEWHVSRSRRLGV